MEFEELKEYKRFEKGFLSMALQGSPFDFSLEPWHF